MSLFDSDNVIMIRNLKMYFILDSSGSNALLVKLWTKSACFQATVPIIDYNVTKKKSMIAIFSAIRTNFIGLNEEDWESFDSMLTQFNKGKKSIDPSLSLALSIACARASTNNELWKLRGNRTRFPYILGTVVSGSEWKEIMLIPDKEFNVLDAFNSLREAWKTIGEELHHKGVLRGMSSRGAWLSDLGDIENLFFVSEIAKDWNMKLGLNIDGSALWSGKNYKYSRNFGKTFKNELTLDEHMTLISAVSEQYKVYYIQDPLRSSDYMSHSILSSKLTDSVISGCKLYKGDLSRLKRGYRISSTKAVTIDPSFLYTVTQLMDIFKFAHGKDLKLVLSRSERETEDHWISDLSISFGADIIKLGVAGGSNIAKFNRLLEIWEDAATPSMGKIKP